VETRKVRKNPDAGKSIVFLGVFSENPPMPSTANVLIHESQFPGNVRRDLLESLRSRRVNHKFHYDSVKQTNKWLALHQVYSPSRNDADCAATYDRSFEAAVGKMSADRVHLVGLGCGGGQKDSRLLHLLKAAGKEVFYTPCDVSTAMVLVARQAALRMVPDSNCFPFVCDLISADDLEAVLDRQSPPGVARLISFFGMIPNFEPELILPKLANLIRPDDTLLFSANLAPGPDYASGVQVILPQYNNEPTREWLMTFLLDLGVERSDGELRFDISEDSAGSGLKRVEARFHFRQDREVQVEGERFRFEAGESVRLFFSHRYTPALVEKALATHGLRVADRWITGSDQEGVFLVKRS
jgi:uncharacterized SAM-dependent methyltransferase